MFDVPSPALTSSSSASTASSAAAFLLKDDIELDPVMEDRSDCGCEGHDDGGDGWSQQEQEKFISLILPYIHGRRLTEEEVQLIRSEALEAHLPLECVDRLIAENEQYNQRQQERLKQKTTLTSSTNTNSTGNITTCADGSDHSKKPVDFDNIDDTIEEVDESDNIMAYFSRMASLKEGGHFPRLNTEAINSFVEEDNDAGPGAEDIEVDYDVGYVNKSFNTSLDVTAIPLNSWEDNDDAQSSVSSHGNRYDAVGYSCSDTADKNKNKFDLFESLLVGDASPRRRVIEEPNPYDSDSFDDSGVMVRAGSNSNNAADDCYSQGIHSCAGSSGDWDEFTKEIRPGKYYAYGHGQELDEWKRKRNIALWQPGSSSGSRSSSTALIAGGSFFSCQSMALAAVADEMNGLLFVRSPPRLEGKNAVRNMMARTKERRRRQNELQQMCHVPERIAEAPKPWQLPYRERCKASPGYIGVDQYSLMDSASVLHARDSRDEAPWELRDVRQHFLDERSISLARNWFGNLRRKRGNDKNTYKPIRPNSMAIPTAQSEGSTGTSRYEDCEWTNATNSKTAGSNTWKTSKEGNSRVNQTASLSFSSGEGSSQSETHDDDDDHTRSVTVRSVNDGTSTFYTEGNASSKAEDQASTTTGDDTCTTDDSAYRHGPRGVQSLSMDADDVDSVGVSAILDEDEDDCDNSAGVSGILDADSGDGVSGILDADSGDGVSAILDADSGDGVSAILDVDSGDGGVSAILDGDNHSDCSSVSSHRGKRDRYCDFLEPSSVSESSQSHSCSGSSHSGSESSGSFCTSDDSESTSSGTWEDIPECGSFINVKPKLGERVSRVTPDHTSHLLRSRFRKKYGSSVLSK